MKKFAVTLAIAAVAGLGLAGVSPAEARNRPAAEAPTECTVPGLSAGITVGEVAQLPSCADFDYLCIKAAVIVGPARVAHVGPQGTGEPCATFPDECVIAVLPDKQGPSRAAHRVGRAVPASIKTYEPGETFQIPETCDDVLASTGANTAPPLLLGLGLFGAGAAFLVVSRRRLGSVGR